jgi:hypothetical protein
MALMKKQYITPASKVVRVHTRTILAGSPANQYYDNQGDIRYSATEVGAEYAD